MNDAELIRQVRDLHELSARLLTAFETADPRDHMTVLARNRESWNGWPSSSGFDRSPRRATDTDGELVPNYSNPTAEAGERTDRAHADRLLMERGVRSSLNLLRTAADAAGRHTLRSPNIIERQSTKEPEAGCTSCARLTGRHGGARWEPIYRGDTCRFCWEYKRATGNLPSKEDLQAHHDGKKIKRPA